MSRLEPLKLRWPDGPFVVEVGKMAGLANGSCLVRYGDTVVRCTATMADSPREGIDFFPLSVDFEEKAVCRGNNSRFLPQERGPALGKRPFWPPA